MCFSLSYSTANIDIDFYIETDACDVCSILRSLAMGLISMDSALMLLLFFKKNKQAQVIQKTTITKITTFQGQQSPKSQHFRGINHNISGTTIIDITTFQGQRSQTSQHVRDNNHNYYKFSGTTITKITTFQGQHSRNSQHFRDTYHKNHNIVVIVGPEILCFLNHLNLLTS